MKRILITGSRDWPAPATIRWAIWEWVKLNSYTPEEIVIVHGAARGADRMAREYVAQTEWLSEEPYPADWKTHGPDCPAWHEGQEICKKAGHRRNELMVDTNPDVVLAFIWNESPGATGCAKYAESHGIPVKYYRLPGLTDQSPEPKVES